MQKAYDALQDNPFGMEIYFGLEKDKPQIFEPSSLPTSNDQEKKEDYIDRKKPDLSVRTFKGPFFRPNYSLHNLLYKYARKSCVDEQIYESTNLHLVDPQKHFSFGIDMWDRDSPKQELAEAEEGELEVINGTGYYRYNYSLN